MQVRTPARPLGPRVGLGTAIRAATRRSKCRFDRTLLAAYTGTHRGHTRDKLFGSRGHYSNKSTASARRAYPGEDRTAQASEDGTADCVEDGTAGVSAGSAGAGSAGTGAGSGAGSGAAATAASDLISMRQPVSLAASRAFCPSLPIASDSW